VIYFGYGMHHSILGKQLRGELAPGAASTGIAAGEPPMESRS